MEQELVTTTHPTEPVDLPSKGVFYPEGSPLRSGQIEIKYMTTKHEDILTSNNLIQKGVVLDRLIDELIATKGVKAQDLLTGDLNAVMVAARILGYGKTYPVKITCPNCAKTIEHTADLTELTSQTETTADTANKLDIVLPVSNATVTLKFLTRKDELDIDKELKSLKKAMGESIGEASIRLRYMIQSVNGNTNKTEIWKFVDSLLVQDARYIRQQYRKHLPDIDFTIKVECECSDEPISVRLPIGINFFWPDA